MCAIQPSLPADGGQCPEQPHSAPPLGKMPATSPSLRCCARVREIQTNWGTLHARLPSSAAEVNGVKWALHPPTAPCWRSLSIISVVSCMVRVTQGSGPSLGIQESCSTFLHLVGSLPCPGFYQAHSPFSVSLSKDINFSKVTRRAKYDIVSPWYLLLCCFHSGMDGGQKPPSRVFQHCPVWEARGWDGEGTPEHFGKKGDFPG